MTSTKTRLKHPLSKTAPTADWYAEHTVAELRDVVEAFGCELPRGLKRDGVLAQIVLIAAEATLVVPLVEAMYEDGYGAAIDLLVAHDGIVAFADANRACGPIDDGDSPLAAVVEVGLAVVATIDGVPAVAMPPVMRPFARAIWERKHPTAAPTMTPAPVPARRGRPPKAVAAAEADAPAPPPARRGRPPKASLPPPPPPPIPPPLAPRTLVRRQPTTPPEPTLATAPVPASTTATTTTTTTTTTTETETVRAEPLVQPQPTATATPAQPAIAPLLTPAPTPPPPRLLTPAPPRFVAVSPPARAPTPAPPRFVATTPAPRTPSASPPSPTSQASTAAQRSQPALASWEVAARRWSLPDGSAVSVAVVVEPFYGRVQSQMTGDNDVAAARAAVEDAIRRKGMPQVVQVETQGIKRAVLAACPDLVVQVGRPGEAARRAARGTRPVEAV